MPAPDGRSGPPPVSLDLIPTQLLLPRVLRIALIAIAVGVVVGVLVWLVAPLWAAVFVGALIAVPPALGAFAASRRHLRLDGTVLTAGGLLRDRTVELKHLAGVEVLVRVARVSQVVLRVNDGDHSLVSVPLALYANGGGRELEILALRKLADAFAASELASAAAVSSVLVEQLRAEARGAELGERPLYRAIVLARDAGRVPQTTLTDHEVAALVD
ncbi:hypothetical protein [Rhodococcus chondri]|uniref:Integral membrane protein n=1 Tax=Rhodococcus chondri TaxID=3065941 RepID=A0ABU7JRS0_9NOCA|nr:hypothetical protein [Rhodococcus sp. CC-R104]MEE2032715.1 hypothetical protein [Rhodococcus sp. CC-R104]